MDQLNVCVSVIKPPRGKIAAKIGVLFCHPNDVKSSFPLQEIKELYSTRWLFTTPVSQLTLNSSCH